MRRTWLGLLTFGLIAVVAVLGACSSDEDKSNAEPIDTRAADVADDVTGEEQADDEPGDGSLAESVAPSDLAGDWTGEWNNTTFGSSASMSLGIKVNDDGTASLTFDLFNSNLGSPFGLEPSGPITLDGTHDENGLAVDVRGHDLFGDMVAFLSSTGRLQADATMDGVSGIIAMSVFGTFTTDGMEAEYTIAFRDGERARQGDIHARIASPRTRSNAGH